MALGRVTPQEHMRRVRQGYLDIVLFVYRKTEERSARAAHSLAMLFLAIDALNES